MVYRATNAPSCSCGLTAGGGVGSDTLPILIKVAVDDVSSQAKYEMGLKSPLERGQSEQEKQAVLG
jgi:hypothetical protein